MTTKFHTRNIQFKSGSSSCNARLCSRVISFCIDEPLCGGFIFPLIFLFLFESIHRLLYFNFLQHRCCNYCLIQIFYIMMIFFDLDVNETLLHFKTNLNFFSFIVLQLNNPDKRVEIIKKFVMTQFPTTPLIDYALKVEQITTSKKPNLILNVDGIIGVAFVDLLRHSGAFTR